MITTKQLDEWEALAKAATDGPWEVYDVSEVDVEGADSENPDNVSAIARGIQTAAGIGLNKGEDYELFDEADADFISASREAVPALIAEVRRMLPVVEAARLEADCYSYESRNRLCHAVSAYFKEATE